MKKVKRILAMAGVILLAGLYVAAFVSAILAKPAADGFFKASLLATIIVPLLLPGTEWTAACYLKVFLANAKKGCNVKDYVIY